MYMEKPPDYSRSIMTPRRRVGKLQAIGRTGLAAAAAIGGVVIAANEASSPGSVSGVVVTTAREAGQTLARVVERTPRGLTEEQRRAAEYFRSLPSDQFVRDIVAQGAIDRGKVIPVKLRNRPATQALAALNKIPSGHEGEVLDLLDRGSIIAKAIVVWGRDPQFPDDPRRQSEWFAFRDPKHPEIIIFAHSAGFEQRPDFYIIVPFDLSKPLPVFAINREAASK